MPLGRRVEFNIYVIRVFPARDGSGIARNAGMAGSDHLGSSYAHNQASYSKEVDPNLVDHFAPSHDPDNAHHQQQDDEQQVLTLFNSPMKCTVFVFFKFQSII